MRGGRVENLTAVGAQVPASLVMATWQPSAVSFKRLLPPAAMSCHTPVTKHGSVAGAGHPLRSSSSSVVTAVGPIAVIVIFLIRLAKNT